MATNKQSKQPATPRCGNIKATIRQNTSERGPLSTATLSRPFKHQPDASRNGTSIDLNDLEALVTVVSEAKDRIAAHASKQVSGFLGASAFRGFHQGRAITLWLLRISRPYKLRLVRVEPLRWRS